jgi:hypothetical protein
MRYHAEHAARAARGERVLISAGILRRLSAAHGASLILDILSGWEQDGDAAILGNWEALPDDAPGVELIYGWNSAKWAKLSRCGQGRDCTSLGDRTPFTPACLSLVVADEYPDKHS